MHNAHTFLHVLLMDIKIPNQQGIHDQQMYLSKVDLDGSMVLGRHYPVARRAVTQHIQVLLNFVFDKLNYIR